MTPRLLLTQISTVILFALLCNSAIAQTNFAKVIAERKGESSYLLTVNFTVPNGMRIYAVTDSSLGLETIALHFEGGNIRKEGPQSLQGKTERFQDPIFNTRLPVIRENFTLTQQISLEGNIPDSITLRITGFAADSASFIPVEETIRLALEGGQAQSSLRLQNFNLQQPLGNCGEQLTTDGDSLWLIFLKGLAGGLLALLMPCIFPMIPVTVSFFMNRSASRKQGLRNGFLYGFFITAIYLLASLPFHLAGNVNPQIFNTISTNQWVNIAFFVIFVLFALSLFGLFELKLPGNWANTAGQKGGLTSIAGIFFMALTLAIVSFSCTGPILGILLVNSIGEGNGAWALTAGMAGFGLALAIPFATFALFPQWMKRLPKSGGWMDTLKVALGFIELALAIKFLSNADLVEHWGILPREIFILLWFLLTLGLAIYLLRVVPAATGRWSASPGTLFSGIITLFFAAYLFTGLLPSGRNGLTILSGLAPPASYSLYAAETKHNIPEPDYINQYDEALELAKRTGKPILLDFTGWACVNCRKMEELVWSQPEVSGLIREKLILVSLYVDDRKPLLPAEQGSYRDATGELRQLKTVGDKWAGFQARNFGQVTQPMYALLSPDGQLLSHPVGYTPNAMEYRQWLLCGVAAISNTTRPTDLPQTASPVTVNPYNPSAVNQVP
jgi:thiol:disulfide interchange protein